MLYRIPLGWLQLKKEKLRLLVAVSGVAFAVILIFMQLGFRRALFDSAVRYHRLLDYDVVLVSPDTDFIANPRSFPRRRLYQAAGFPAVESVSSVYMQLSVFENPFDHTTRGIFVVGFDPDENVIEVPAVQRSQARLKLPDVVLFDAASRPEYGPVAEYVDGGRPLTTEVGKRRIQVVDLFELGPSFGIDGNVLTSDLNFRRLFPQRPPGLIDLGLVRLREGADVAAVREALDQALEDDVLVLTKPEFVAREVAYWDSATPIGYVFGFGVIVGLVVGAIIVYQILFADVSDHLPEYATLKAMGYPAAFLFWVVIQEAVILAVLGYLPGLAISLGLYRLAGDATKLPMELTPERGVAVLGLTIGMCIVSGLIAVRKVRSADPAEIF